MVEQPSKQPSTPKRKMDSEHSSADASPSKKKSPAKAASSVRSSGSQASATALEADASSRSSAWSDEESSIFWRDILRQYKPDWVWISKEFDALQNATGESRTKKARQLYYQRHIRSELLKKACMP